ncbi:2-hydroxyacid dehydrogenase [Paenibacillus camelliae]|uniref:2-hydroxyacid dehydrogenase n=1 Tax=Paenibacillus camelliae TaxID=512410 RepID=UPI00203FC76C|nr:D-glycerate dehydrogenase [Paenibacillus camelliae]MCM3634594.1 D-glycerate dehydrogenase [Paenibacillus camelliae]
MKPQIYVTRKIPDQALQLLLEHTDVLMWENEDVPVPRDILEAHIRQVDGLYSMLTDTIDATLLQQTTRLKVISNMAVGYNNIDINAANKKGITVTNTPGVLTETTADLTFALLMATARRIVESQQLVMAGQWKTWSPMLLTGQDIFGATIGIIGMGRIGEALVKRAQGFQMNIQYYNRTRKPELEHQYRMTYTDLHTLLATSDFVCIMTPLTPETKHMIGMDELKLMKKSAILINTARGGIVDEAALYEVLSQGGIWGAGLDVFEQEPVPVDHPLLSLPNVVALPHIGSASIQTRTKMAIVAAQQLIKVLHGEKAEHTITL